MMTLKKHEGLELNELDFDAAPQTAHRVRDAGDHAASRGERNARIDDVE
jgi:hypothetical protein